MKYIKEIVFSILVLFMTLEMFSQSPRFSFYNDSIVLATSKRNNFEVYRGTYTSPEDVINKKHIIGSFSHNTKHTIFKPIVPFQKGNEYTVVFKNEVYPFVIAIDENYDYLQVEVLYPNASVLPANFLKWYIQFSKPVNPSKIYDHIYLINTSDNTKVDRALLPLETPLLSEDGKLLTLWIEPGRQKRDLGPNRELGEVLILNKSYTLIIDKELKDTQGIAMQEKYMHSFKVGNFDRIKPSIISWKIDVPKVNTREALRINFQEYLDYGSLKGALEIVNESGTIIDGDFTINVNQNFALFKPAQDWGKGTYILKCDSIIEDLAGNNLERLFDRDVTVKKIDPILEISFVIQ